MSPQQKPSPTDRETVVDNLARGEHICKSLDAMGITDGLAKVAFLEMIFCDAHYHSPAYHVITVGISLALIVLMLGMAVLLVLSTAGLLG